MVVTEWTQGIIDMVLKGHSRQAVDAIIYRYPGLPRTSAIRIMDMIMDQYLRRSSGKDRVDTDPDA